MHGRMVWLAALGIFGTLAAHAGELPRPNRDKPVDYIAWMNKGFSSGITHNAADDYLAAAALLPPCEPPRKYPEVGDPDAWSESDRARLQTLVDENEKALKRFAEAARGDRCYFTLASDSGGLIDVMLPELADLRYLARLTALRAELRLWAGDLDGALQDVDTVLRAAHHMFTQPMTIQYLVGLSILKPAYDVLLSERLLAARGFDAHRALSLLEKCDPKIPPPHRQFTLEKIMAWDVAQRCLRDNDSDGRFDSIEFPAVTEIPPGPVFPAKTFDETVDELTEFFDGLRALCDPDYQNARKAVAELQERIRATKGSLLSILGPSLGRVALLYRRAWATRNAVRVVLLLHAYRGTHGQWPETLLKALPADAAEYVIDPFANQPLCYRLKDGAPLLYSVSDNGTDDGGACYRKDGEVKWNESKDFVFWPPQK